MLTVYPSVGPLTFWAQYLRELDLYMIFLIVDALENCILSNSEGPILIAILLCTVTETLTYYTISNKTWFGLARSANLFCVQEKTI